LQGGAAELGGGPTLLHFWATWCVPCVAELPALDRLAEELGRQGVKVLVVSEDRGGANDVRPFLARLAPMPHLTVLLDPERRAAARLQLKAVPTTLVVGADGRERARLTGAGDWAASDRAMLSAELGR
jgi:thiol-disulfide isomerase/thioredoxin